MAYIRRTNDSARVIAVVLAVLLLSALAVFAYMQKGAESGNWVCLNGTWTKQGNPQSPAPTTGCGSSATSTPTITPTTTPTSALISVTQPRTDDIITSPVRIAGEARGTWYFEASFPVKLLDGSGKLLAQAPAQAQGEWMTEAFVPFVLDMSFPLPSTATGTLVLEKDNPSGLPQYDAQVSIPVRFQSGTSTSAGISTLVIKVFFGNNVSDPDVSDCNKVYPTSRTIAKTPSIARKALEELLAGPTQEEKNKGFFTSINPGVDIQSLVIENGTAKADFSKKLEEAVGGSCRVAAISAQIRETLKQFPTVKNVIISIDGRTEDILQP